MSDLERAASATMDTFWHHHQVGDFDAGLQLLDSFNYSAEAIDFTLNPDSYYFPNHRNGKLVRPKGIDDEKIPIVALENGRTYQFEDAPLHTLQRAALLGAGLTQSDINTVASDFRNDDHEIRTSGRHQAAASVYHRISDALPNHSLITSRPLLIFDVDPSQPVPERFCAGVALHEVIHVAQSLSQPAYDHTRELRKELEAYAVEATLVSCFQVEYSLGLAMAGTVDLFRQKYLGKLAFEPTDFFIEELQKDDIVSRIWNPKKIA